MLEKRRRKRCKYVGSWLILAAYLHQIRDTNPLTEKSERRHCTVVSRLTPQLLHSPVAFSAFLSPVGITYDAIFKDFFT